MVSLKRIDWPSSEERKLQPSQVIRDYLRPQMLPSTWCPGCGLGIVLNSIMHAVHLRGLRNDDITMVSGIGCTGRTSGYADFNTIHTTHGRAPAFATGVKLAQPRMTVITVMGDGDAMSIGGNHLLHAMRRNIGMVAIVVNNNVYALTGGQSSPTTPVGGMTTTTADGAFERPMNLEALARSGGAAFYARGAVSHARSLIELITRALAVDGFALVEIVSNCHVIYGRMNNMAEAAAMISAMESNTRPSNPTLARRSALCRRVTTSEPHGTPVTDAIEGVSRDGRTARGIVFDRPGLGEYSRRYRAEAARRRKASDTEPA